MRCLILVTLLTTALGFRVAHAQAQLIPDDASKAADDKAPQGWNPFLGLTSTLSMVDNENTVGQVAGFSTLFGLGLLGGADYIKDEHSLQTTLTINEGFARTPVVDRFVKTNDNVKLESLYSYFLSKTLGVYGRLSLATSILETDDVRGTPTSWVDATGATPKPLTTNGFSQKLGSAFKPFTINEAVGGFADPIKGDKLDLTLRLGIGGRHTFADGLYVNHDDASTPEIELLELSDVHQLGVEAFAGANGKFEKQKLNYKAGVAVLFPFVNNDSFDRSTTALTRVSFEGNVTYAMSSWLSLVYGLVVTRDPQLFPAGKELVQVQNTLLLTFTANLVSKKEKAKEKSKEEKELEEANQRADAAEKRATDAEQKLQQSQTVPPPAPEPTPAPAPAPTPAPTPAP